MINADFCNRLIIDKKTSRIDTILAKEVFCKHDVKKINKIYRNDPSVLNKIVEAIEKIAQEKNLFNLISLYHLQSFVGKDSNLEKHFSQMWSQIDKNPEMAKEMANYLSCCHSGQKRGKPQNYPLYLQKLLVGGYIHLYDHLMLMRTFENRMTRQDEINKSPFSLLSHIILEAREAIIQEVKNSIPDPSSNILFLIGGTGAGKSTTLCFLRGDEMTHEDFCYQSKNDLEGMIGHQSERSCTFLPTVEKVNDWIIVDFPGFEDTNGSLVSMGIEFALKALIKEYHPKVMVLESIAKIEAKALGNRLERLFKNKKDCLLGITKYANDTDFDEIKSLETKQIEDQNLEINQVQKEIDVLKGALEYAVEDGLSEEDIQKMEQELVHWQQKKEEINLELAKFVPQILPDTLLKAERREKLQEKEAILIKETGIKNIFRFDNLSNHELVPLFFQTLLEIKPLDPSIENILDADDERLVNDRFENGLEDYIINNINTLFDSNNFDAFKQSILETSFISTLFSQSHPEIGKLLHLPEMDPNRAYYYDQKIITQSIEKIAKFVVQKFNLSLIEKVLLENKENLFESTVIRFQNKLNQIVDYLIIILNREKSLKKTDIAQKWAELQKEYQNDLDKINIEQKWVELQKEYQNDLDKIEQMDIFTYAKILFKAKILYGCIVLIPTIFWLVKKYQKIELTEEMMETYDDELHYLYNFLVKLKELEKITLNQKQLRNELKPLKIARDSLESIDTSIKQYIDIIRTIYDKDVWDRRIELLKDQFSLRYFYELSQKISQKDFPLFTYLLINSQSYFKVETDKSFTKTFKSTKEFGGFESNDGESIKLETILQSELFLELVNNKIKIPQFYIHVFNEPSLINRILNAAAFLKANEVK